MLFFCAEKVLGAIFGAKKVLVLFILMKAPIL